MDIFPYLIANKIQWYLYQEWLQKGYATIHLLSLGKNDDWDYLPTAEDIEVDHPGFTKAVKRGDLIENVDESGYRSEGVYMIDIVDGQIIIRSLEYNYDEYGSPSIEFKCWTEFPLNYWDYNHMKINKQWIPNGDVESYWHDTPAVVVDLKKMLFHAKLIKGQVIEEYIPWIHPWNQAVDYKYITWIYRGRTYMVTIYLRNEIIILDLLAKELKADKPIYVHLYTGNDHIIKKIAEENKIRNSDICELYPFC